MHFHYLKYLLRHKWWVLVASRKVGASLWLAIIHDMSKFRPSEWLPYARHFYPVDKQVSTDMSSGFTFAWNDHQKRNKHHWQYWLITWDNGKTEPLQMPIPYVLEMVSDWAGAGRAITGKWDVWGWYEKNKEKMTLHKITRMKVEYILEVLKTRIESESK